MATLAGVGRAPVAPGTVASAVVAVALWLAQPAPLARLVALVLVVAVGTWASHEAEPVIGGKDPGAIVVDEVAGMMLAVAAAPLTPGALAAGFLLFRLFDVVKPFPANTLQRVRGGAGVMLDDLVAGLYALLGVALLRTMAWV